MIAKSPLGPSGRFCCATVRFTMVRRRGSRMRMWQIAQKNLWRRPIRSILTAVALAIAVAAVVALVGVSESLESSFFDLYWNQGTDLVVQRRGGAVQVSKGISLSIGDQIRKIPGVEQVIGSLMDMISFEE